MLSPTLSARILLWLLISASLGGLPGISFAEEFAPRSSPSASSQIESRFVVPDVVTATIFSASSNSAPALFTFRRTIQRTASTLKVLREYWYADGTPAAREHVVYENESLALYQLEELQTGDFGSATIKFDPSDPARGRVMFQYVKAGPRHPTTSTRSEALQPNTLINDTVGTFLAAHWDQLFRGEKVACRYIVLSRRETVGVTFRKESDALCRGREVIGLKMEPTNLLIAALVQPLRFLVEKAPPHRVLQYIGPTAPKLGQAGHWTEFNDALTIFDW